MQITKIISSTGYRVKDGELDEGKEFGETQVL